MSKSKVVAPIVVLLLAGAFVEAAGQPVVPCAENSVTATGIRSTEDVEAFVQCAYEYVQEMGFEEAYRAFHEDARWNSGQFYVFVRMLAPRSELSERIVQPTDPSSERMPLGPLIDRFGTDVIGEFFRILQLRDRGWSHYEFLNPESGLTEPKAAYLVHLDWQGEDAVLGAGIYRRDIPGTCHAVQVNAALLSAEPSMERLEEFVRYAALEVESKGYFVIPLLESDPRWQAGSIYLFGMDLMGNQLFSGMWNGERIPEWVRYPRALFNGRDVTAVAEAFGESHIYYHAIHPETGRWQSKAAFIMRVSGQGVPILIGAGIYIDCPPSGCGSADEAACEAARQTLADFPAMSVQYGFYTDHTPVSYSVAQESASHRPMGYEPDLVAAVETLSGRKLSFNALALGNPFSGIWLKAAQEPYDMVGGGITALPERTRDAEGRPVIRFGVGHISFSQSLLVPEASAIERHDDLTSEHRVGTYRATTGEKRLLELTGIIDSAGFIQAGTRVQLADGTLLTTGPPDHRTASRACASPQARDPPPSPPVSA